MPPATSTRENALAALKTTLAAVAKGAAYNYTFDDVLRLDGPWWERVDIDNYGGNTIVFVEEGETAHEPETQDGKYVSTMEVFIDAITRYKPDSDNPLQQTTEVKSTIRSKLLGDLVKSVMANDSLDGNAEYGVWIKDDAPITVDLIDQERWTGVFTRFEVKYQLDEDAP